MTPAKAQIDTSLANQLQAVLDNSVNISGNHGVSAHLIMPGGQTWDGTAGVGKQNIPITDTTVFHGASTTKLNVAILMLMLAEDGLVNLDSSWHKYVSLNVSFDTMITVRQLLNHTSGIADYLETAATESYVTSDYNYFFTPQYILENIVSGVPDFPAGTNFRYSTSNYVLAGLIAEAVTGNPVQTELRNRIWNPLGMNHTYFGAYDTYSEPAAGVWWDFGSGLTDYSNMPTTSMLSYGYGGANIVSCPTDLALLLNALFDNQLLSQQSMNEMLTFIPQSFSSWTDGYGLGIHHQSGQTTDLVLGHDGYYTNLTDMFHSANYGFTLVTMTNTATAWFGIFNPMYNILKNYFVTEVPGLENNVGVTVYPNPASEGFSITCSKIIDQLTVKDILGRTVYESSPHSKNFSLKLGQSGCYLLTVESGGQTSAQKLIVE